MQNPLKRQFEGFQDTPLLWKSKKFKDLCQFEPSKVRVMDDQIIKAKIPFVTSNFVMGKRMENFFELQLKDSASYHILAKNIQIHRNGITLGELDFILKDLLHKQVIHLEMVYKFYVYDPSFENETERWIGPNRKDSLLQKISKIVERQFPLLYEPETVSYLSGLGLSPESIDQRVCFKANLFFPINFQQKNMTVFNPECVAGYWMHFEEFTSGKYSTFNFYAPKKISWPVNPEYNEEWVSFSEIAGQIEALFQKGKSPLIWMKKNEFSYERFFVVWW